MSLIEHDISDVVIRRTKGWWSESAIAHSLELPVNTVRNIVRRARSAGALTIMIDGKPTPLRPAPGRKMLEPPPETEPKADERRLTPRQQAMILVQRVADWHDVPVHELIGKNRESHIVKARDEAMATVSLANPDWTLARIGSLFSGRDHSTVSHSFSKTGRRHKGMRSVQTT